jgi:hypothetical protein
MHPPFHPGAVLVVPQLQLEIAGDEIFASHDLAPVDLKGCFASVSHLDPPKRAIDRVEQECPTHHVMVPGMVGNRHGRRLGVPVRSVNDHTLTHGLGRDLEDLAVVVGMALEPDEPIAFPDLAIVRFLAIEREKKHPHRNIHRRVDHQPIAAAAEGEHLAADIAEGLVVNPIDRLLRRRHAGARRSGRNEQAQKNGNKGKHRNAPPDVLVNALAAEADGERQ